MYIRTIEATTNFPMIILPLTKMTALQRSLNKRCGDQEILSMIDAPMD